MSFIIDPNSASFAQIREDLKDFLDAAPDADKWKDFFDSSTGQTVIDLIAGLGVFTQYNTIVARRESFIQFAENRSSVIGGSQTLGYSVDRGRNVVLALNVTPNVSGLLSKFTVVGTVLDQDLILLEDTTVNSGTVATLNVVVGTVKDQSITVPGDGPQSFRFTDPLVTEDARVLLNDDEQEISDRILDLINEKFVVQSNPFDSADVKYLNQEGFEVRYDTGDIIKLEWVERKQLDDFTITDMIFDLGILNSFTVTELFRDVESIDSARINAPLFNETQFIVRGRNDFLKIFQLLDPQGLADTGARDVSGAVIELVYVNNDLSILTDAEKNAFSDEIQRPFGVAPPLFADPQIIFLIFDVDLVLKGTGDPETVVRDLLALDEKKLEIQISFEDLEDSLEGETFIKIARIKIGSVERINDNPYLLGNTITPAISPDACGDIVFQATRFICLSGSIEPTCPSAEDDLVNDGEVVWQAKDPAALGICDPVAELALWAPTTDYQVGARVRLAAPCAFILEAIDCLNLSNAAQEIQQINFDAVPLSGSFRIEVGAEETTDLAFGATNTDVQNALNALDQFDTVVVTGDFTTGFNCVLDPNVDHPLFTFADLGNNEIQCLQPDLVATGGIWRLDFEGDETSDLAFNINAATLQTALEGLPSIGAGNVTVAGGMATRFLVEFISGLGTQNQNDIVVSVNTLVIGASVVATPSTTTEGRVVDAGQNEIQDITFTSVPDGGEFSLEFNGKTTELIPFTADNNDVELALEALDTITAGEVSVTGDFSGGFTVEFQNALGDQDVVLITVPVNDLTISQGVNETITTVQEGGGGNNEVQEIEWDFEPDAGEWKITFDGEETALMSFAVNNVTVRTELEALSNIGTDNVEVSGNFATGFVITFIGALANTNVAEVTVSFNTLTKGQPVNMAVIETTKGRVVDAGQDEIQRIDFDFIPDSGNWQIGFAAETTSTLTSASSNTDVENALNALTGLSAVVVTGDFTNGFVINFTGADGLQPQVEVTIASNTLFASSAPITFDTCGEAVEGKPPASNLGDTANPGNPSQPNGTDVAITVIVQTEGANPEPGWPGTIECPV